MSYIMGKMHGNIKQTTTTFYIVKNNNNNNNNNNNKLLLYLIPSFYFIFLHKYISFIFHNTDISFHLTSYNLILFCILKSKKKKKKKKKKIKKKKKKKK